MSSLRRSASKLAAGDLRGLRLAVVGHVESAEFARVPHLPRTGEIVHADRAWRATAGGGAVAAVQLAHLCGGATFFTALSDDDDGHGAAGELQRMGVDVRAGFRRREDLRRVFVHVDAQSERTITVIGHRLGPRRRDPLGWADLASFDGVYFTAGDGAAVRAARRARLLIATARAIESLRGTGVELDALMHSAGDANERYARGELDPEPKLVVTTEGSRGGRWRQRGDGLGRYPSFPPPGPIADTYGCGDVFAAGLTAGLAAGFDRDAALWLAARCGAVCATGDGPYGRQLRLERGNLRP
jgi:ribokinase